MKFHRTIFLFLVCSLFAFSAFAQDKNKNGDSQITVKTNLMVLDSKEQFAEVKPEDIKIFEDGIEQKVTNLYKKEAANVGIVIDNTGSMRFQLETILQTASLFVQNLRENDQAFTVRFVSKDKIQTAQDWTSNKNLLQRSLENMFIEGGMSAVVDAVKFSADKLIQKKDDSRRSALILISDCEDRASDNKVNDVLKSLKDNGIEVYVIGLMQDLGEGFKGKSPKEKSMQFAQNLASISGGMTFFPKNSKKNQNEIIEAAKTIVYEIRSQYVVEYVSTNQKMKDKERKLSVQITDAPDGEKRTAFMRSFINLGEK